MWSALKLGMVMPSVRTVHSHQKYSKKFLDWILFFPLWMVLRLESRSAILNRSEKIWRNWFSAGESTYFFMISHILYIAQIMIDWKNIYVQVFSKFGANLFPSTMEFRPKLQNQTWSREIYLEIVANYLCRLRCCNFISYKSSNQMYMHVVYLVRRFVRKFSVEKWHQGSSLPQWKGCFVSFRFIC